MLVEGHGFETTEVRIGHKDGTSDPKQDLQALRITVPLRCHFRVELTDAGRGDAIELLDARGEAMDLVRIEGTSRYSGSRKELHDGRSPVLNVLEGARTLVLYKAGAAVQRLEVTLVPGQVTVVTL